jgi:hypothetical protein
MCLVARKKDGSWSAPVAVGGMSLSAGFSAGAKLTDSMVLLMDPAEVQNFSGVGTVIDQGVAASATVLKGSAGVSATCQQGTKSASLSAGGNVGSKSVRGVGQVNETKIRKAIPSSSSSNMSTTRSSNNNNGDEEEEVVVVGDGGFKATYTYNSTFGLQVGATGHGGFLTVNLIDMIAPTLYFYFLFRHLL